MTCHASVCSAISSASSTSIPSGATVGAIRWWPSSKWVADYRHRVEKGPSTDSFATNRHRPTDHSQLCTRQLQRSCKEPSS
jgi:hypothetical protein